VHLIDKEDGAIDGIPEVLLHKQYAIPWIELITCKIEEICVMILVGLINAQIFAKNDPINTPGQIQSPKSNIAAVAKPSGSQTGATLWGVEARIREHCPVP
jgi:hypothetical protein